MQELLITVVSTEKGLEQIYRARFDDSEYVHVLIDQNILANAIEYERLVDEA